MSIYLVEPRHRMYLNVGFPLLPLSSIAVEPRHRMYLNALDARGIFVAKQ